MTWNDSTGHLDAAKAELRTEILRDRRRHDPARRSADAQRVLATLLTILSGPGAVVAAYAPVGNEPGGSLPQTLRSNGFQVLLPVLLPDNDLDWALFDTDLDITDRRLREPPGPRLGVEAIRSATAVVVPALAVAVTGTRLGRGGGSYDRALARVATGTPVIALLHDGEYPRAVPEAPHDRPVTDLITPSGGHHVV